MDVPCSLGDMMASSPITQGGGYLLALMLDAMVMKKNEAEYELVKRQKTGKN